MVIKLKALYPGHVSVRILFLKNFVAEILRQREGGVVARRQH
jgi:hypothetical protein